MDGVRGREMFWSVERGCIGPEQVENGDSRRNRLTMVYLETWPLNWCVCVCVIVISDNK